MVLFHYEIFVSLFFVNITRLPTVELMEHSHWKKKIIIIFFRYTTFAFLGVMFMRACIFSVYIFSIQGPSGKTSELYLYQAVHIAANHSISSYVHTGPNKHRLDGGSGTVEY